MNLLHLPAFVFLYLWQVVRSTGCLAWWVLRPRLDLHPRFIDYPLTVEGELPRFFFVCLVSMTPGSLSVTLDSSRPVLVIHLLDGRDEEGSIREMKRCIETPLLRVLGKSPTS